MTQELNPEEIAATVVRKFKRAEAIGDEELETTIKYLTHVVEFLRGCGREYSLVKSDLHEILETLDGFLRDRKW